jgi:hypothetical protein
MYLESEPVTVTGDWAKRAATLRRHGAIDDEIAFLRNRRVELNAMTYRQLIDFVEAKFAEHNVTKLIPDQNVIEQQGSIRKAAGDAVGRGNCGDRVIRTGLRAPARRG